MLAGPGRALKRPRREHAEVPPQIRSPGHGDIVADQGRVHIRCFYGVAQQVFDTVTVTVAPGATRAPAGGLVPQTVSDCGSRIAKKLSFFLTSGTSPSSRS